MTDALHVSVIHSGSDTVKRIMTANKNKFDRKGIGGKIISPIVTPDKGPGPLPGFRMLGRGFSV
jgi:hypothetical protein